MALRYRRTKLLAGEDPHNLGYLDAPRRSQGSTHPDRAGHAADGGDVSRLSAKLLLLPHTLARRLVGKDQRAIHEALTSEIDKALRQMADPI